MKAFLFLALFAPSAFGAACCGGGGSKSFISLQRLQTYEVGISSIFRDVYGLYNDFGEVDETRPNQTLSFLLGAGMRLTQDFQASLTLPLVHQSNSYGAVPTTRQGVGDVVVSAQYTLLESLFIDDWYPTLQLQGGIKAPTGNQEQVREGRRYPGTGNGIWEPYFGVQAQKNFGSLTLLARGTYTARSHDHEDGIETVESATWVFHPELSLTLGSVQVWNFENQRRVTSFFLSPLYFLNRYWSVAAGFEISPSWDRFGVNEPAYRSLSLTTRYGFY